MSQLPGNPHADDAQRLIHADNTWTGIGYETADAQHIVGHLEANTQALMAIAFEIRTQTLVAAHQMAVSAMEGMSSVDVPEEVEDAMRNQSEQITERLGGGA